MSSSGVLRAIFVRILGDAEGERLSVARTKYPIDKERPIMAKVAFIGLGVMGYPMAGHLA